MQGRERSAPTRLGRYAVIAPLGKGGMASVYLGRSEGPGGFSRRVALKVLHANYAADSELIEQFIEEAKIAALIRHPNVVSVHEVGEDADVFLVMDYVDGGSLASLTRAARDQGRSLPLPVFVRILCDALAGLHAAHELRDDAGQLLGVVHRDFSPQNILVARSGLTQLTDFGVAKILTAPGRTRSGVIKGKVRYMPPEQVRGDSLDRRCDVWAAGVILWEALAGKRLYGKKDDVAMLVDIATKPVPPLADVAPHLPRDLTQLVMDALSRDREARIPSAEELRQRLLRTAASYCGVAEMADVAREVQALLGSVELSQGIGSEPSYSPPSALAAHPVEIRESSSEAASNGDAPQTDTISLETLPKHPLQRRSRVVPLAVGIAGLGIAGFLLMQQFSVPEEPAIVEHLTPAVSAPVPAASPSVPRAAPTASVAQEVVDASAPRVPEAGSAKVTRQRPVPRRAPQPRSSKPPAPNPDTLPPSPY